MRSINAWGLDSAEWGFLHIAQETRACDHFLVKDTTVLHPGVYLYVWTKEDNLSDTFIALSWDYAMTEDEYNEKILLIQVGEEW